MRLGAEASGRGPREEPLFTLADAVEAFAGDVEAGTDGPRPLAFIRMKLAVWIAARDPSWVERAPRSGPFWKKFVFAVRLAAEEAADAAA